jgi:hypothetical protein
MGVLQLLDADETTVLFDFHDTTGAANPGTVSTKLSAALDLGSVEPDVMAIQRIATRAALIACRRRERRWGPDESAGRSGGSATSPWARQDMTDVGVFEHALGGDGVGLPKGVAHDPTEAANELRITGAGGEDLTGELLCVFWRPHPLSISAKSSAHRSLVHAQGASGAQLPLEDASRVTIAWVRSG